MREICRVKMMHLQCSRDVYVFVTKINYCVK